MYNVAPNIGGSGHTMPTMLEEVVKRCQQCWMLGVEMLDPTSNIVHAFFVYYENADLVYDVIRMRQLSKQTLHELSPNDNS